MKLAIDLHGLGDYVAAVMKTNLTSPRYRHTIDLSNRIDHAFIRMGILRLSPGQWVTTDGGKTKARFVRLSANGDLWLVYGTCQRKFRLACQTWLANKQIAA